MGGFPIESPVSRACSVGCRARSVAAGRTDQRQNQPRTRGAGSPTLLSGVGRHARLIPPRLWGSPPRHSVLQGRLAGSSVRNGLWRRQPNQAGVSLARKQGRDRDREHHFPPSRRGDGVPLQGPRSLWSGCQHDRRHRGEWRLATDV
jgi:hypothetical protein